MTLAEQRFKNTEIFVKTKKNSHVGARSCNKLERGNLLTYSDLFMVSPTYQLIRLFLTVREQEAVGSVVWESQVPPSAWGGGGLDRNAAASSYEAAYETYLAGSQREGEGAHRGRSRGRSF